MGKIGALLLSAFWDSVQDEQRKVIALLEKGERRVVLDCGCSDGALTVQIAYAVGTNDVYGIDLDKKLCEKARQKDIKVVHTDLNTVFPFESNFFDVVTAIQIIEHLHNIDNFVREVERILKPTGYTIISTENLSSWHNMFALLLGYQDFSHHISRERHIGNPLSPHYLKTMEPNQATHDKILTARSLKDLFEIHGFEIKTCVGAGYYPLSGKISSLLSSFDPYHSARIIIKATKRSETRNGT